MANLKPGEQILLFDTLFLILLTFFGSAVTGVSLAPLQNIQSPALAPLPPGKQQTCQNTDAGCIAQNLALATAYIGWAFVNLPILIVYFLSTILIYAQLILSITFSPAFSANGVPVIGIFFTTLQLFVAMMVFRDWRGSSIL